MRLAIAVGTAALVLFHALLFWRRLVDLTLLQPEVALRWAGAALLLAAAWALRRAGVPLMYGRGSAVFWLLVLLLHVQVPGFVPGAGVGAATTAADPGSLPMLPVAMGLVAVCLLLLCAGRTRPASASESTPRRLQPDEEPPGAAWLESVPALLSRPPPALPSQP